MSSARICIQAQPILEDDADGCHKVLAWTPCHIQHSTLSAGSKPSDAVWAGVWADLM